MSDKITDLLLLQEAKINELYAERSASQSRERVYREALEVLVEALDNLVRQLPTDDRLTEFQLDLQEQALVVARAALTNNKLDEETNG